MRTMSSFGITKFTTGFAIYLRSPFRSREFLSSLVAMTVLCAFSALILAKAWSHISIYIVGWIVFSMFWEIQLLRNMLRLHGSLQMLLATQQVDPQDEKSPMGAALDIVSAASNQSTLFNLFSTFALLMALAYVLSGR
jgi:hypothetical protein